MKTKIISILMAVVLIVILTDCKKKKVDPHVPPDVVFKSGTKFLTGDCTLPKQDTVWVGIIATKTEDDLKSYNASYAYDGATTTTTFYNYYLNSNEYESYSKDIQIITRNQNGTEKWVFSIVDRDGNITPKNHKYYRAINFDYLCNAMQIQVMKSKLHCVTVTQAELDYIGSVTIDKDLMEAANLIENEQVHVLNKENGERFITYVITGARGSGVICLNGPAAKKVKVGDVVLIISYCEMEFEKAKSFRPWVVFPDTATNTLKK